METTRTLHQTSVHRLESQNRSLEVTITTMGSFIQQLIDSRTDIEIPGDVRRIVAQLSLSEKRRNNMRQTSRLIEDNNNKYDMRKTNSTGNRDARLVKANSMMETPFPLKSALSQPNLGSKLEKVSSFFANSHNHIKQQRAQMAAIRHEGSNETINSLNSNGGNDENDPKTVNIDIQITDAMNNTGVDNGTVQNDNLKIDLLANLEKSVSLPRNAKIQLKSSKSAYELGK